MARLIALCLLALGAAGCASLPGAATDDIRARAEAAYEADEFAAAARGYGKYLEHRPGDARAWYRLGYAQAQLGRLEAAEASLRRALALDPEMARARHNLGLVQIQLGVSAILSARRSLPEVDRAAAQTMQYLACLMEIFMGYPRPKTCEPGFADEPAGD
ncbi:tetratricopeptide repeat protein [Ectothiorhodospiraceae bacterium WFHF3C12]|nr:tetratricopeptide repeat protein [Ectothiorhodospiraceae bacterium WFHF3C12]